MGPNGKDAGSDVPRLGLVSETDMRGADRARRGDELEVVFDFTGLHQPGLCDLALILTARLQTDPDERVWVRALPHTTWAVLRALGLEHMFHVLPGPGEVRN